MEENYPDREREIEELGEYVASLPDKFDPKDYIEPGIIKIADDLIREVSFNQKP